MKRVVGVAGLVMACRGSQPVSEGMQLDRPDPAGDHALVWPAPLDSSALPQPGEAPLRAFSCTKEITGKRPNGRLEIAFTPTTPADVSFRIAFRGADPACSYTTEIHVAGGRLDDGFLGRAYTYRCRRSPLSVFAVSCGPYLGSDLGVLVRGNGWGRTVAFRLPWSVRVTQPAACDLPFVTGDAERGVRFDPAELVFDFADCRPLHQT